MTQTADGSMTARSASSSDGADEIPLPSAELIWRVGGGPEPGPFMEGGRRSVRELELALHLLDRSLDSYSRILDFGCGCGRTMRWMGQLAQRSSLHGTDIDERAIRWARENIPFASFEINRELPPLPYPDGSFELVYSHSVFTHLDEAHQDRWLDELKRVTAPGGHLVITIHGPHALAKISEDLRQAGEDPEPLRQALETEGILFLRDDAFVGGPFPDSYHTTLHAPWYVLERWGLLFTVKAYLPQRSLGFQDLVVLEHPADGTPSLTGGRGASRSRSVATEVADETGREPTVRSVARDFLRRAAHRLGIQRAPALRRADPKDGHRSMLALNEVVFNPTTQREILRSFGDRINRLEADTIATLEEHRRKLEELERRLSVHDRLRG